MIGRLELGGLGFAVRSRKAAGCRMLCRVFRDVRQVFRNVRQEACLGACFFLVFILGLYDLLGLMCLALTVVATMREKNVLL